MKRDDRVSPTGGEDVLIAAQVASHIATLVEIRSSWSAQDAAEALGRLGPQGLRALAEALADTSLDVESRQWAALALGDSGNEEAALGPLVAALGYTGARYLPLAAVIALGRLGTVGAAEALSAALADTTGAFGGSHAHALRRIGASAVPALLRALRGDSAIQRCLAAWVLEWVHDPQALGPLLTRSAGWMTPGQRRNCSHCWTTRLRQCVALQRVRSAGWVVRRRSLPSSACVVEISTKMTRALQMTRAIR